MADIPENFEQAQATRGHSHVEVGLQPSFGPATHAYVLVKQTYAIDPQGQRCTPAEAEPLYWDMRVREPRILPGTDFWLHKPLTDVVVDGAACSAAQRPVTRMQVSIQVGQAVKHVDVHGDRPIEWTREGRPRIGAAAPFTRVSLGHENAYGGLDARVPIDPDDPMLPAAADDVDHPGVYPRNPWGKGYIVEPHPIEGLTMPNLEDPGDPLSAERLLVGDPKLWYRQPLAWYLAPAPMLTFPRYVHLMPDTDAWYPGPQDERMPEVRRGFLQAGYADQMRGPGAVYPTQMLRQEASHGMMLTHLRGGEPVTLIGMHPEHGQIQFPVPPLPRVELRLDGTLYPTQPVATNLRIEPDGLRVMLTCAATLDLPRTLVPGIHKHVDLDAHLNGEPAVQYVPPQTVRDRIAEAKAKLHEPTGA